MKPANNEKIFRCWCTTKVNYSNEDNMIKHIQQCERYHQESPFYKEFQRLPIDKLQEVHLVAIKSEFSFYLSQINQQLQERGYRSSLGGGTARLSGQNQPVNPPDDDFEQFSGLSMTKNISNNQSQIKKVFDPSAFTVSHSLIFCLKCNGKFDGTYDTEKIWYLVNCLHTFCRQCLNKEIIKDFLNQNGQIKCHECSLPYLEDDYKNLIGVQRFEDLSQKLIEVQFNIITCFKCKEKFEFQVGKMAGNIKDQNGKLLTKQHEEHYINNRFMCQNGGCKTEQCKGCKCSPYHLSYTCEEYAKFQQSKHCRYCDAQINKVEAHKPLALQDICNEDECQKKTVYACEKMHACGHPCNGFKNEINCLPCMNEKCCEQNSEALNGQTGDDYCNVCFVEGIINAPALKLACGHYFHFHCMKKRLEIRWPSARVTFNFCLCPLCKCWMEFPIECELQTYMQKNLAMIEDIKKKSLERLKFEERLKDPKLTDKNSPYFNKPQEYAIAIYAYYMCFKCKKTYFGGHKDCQQAMDEGNKEFNEKELICANCCDIPIENCAKHGNDFIEFKCKFCCSVAQWFCWGTTHFCDPCHKRQCSGDYLSKYTKDKLPKCNGKNSCPLKVDHKPNGDECSLGCSICRNVKENARDF